MNRGELSPKGVIVDDFLDSLAQLFSNHISMFQETIDSKFALVALASAKLENLNDYVNIVFEATKSKIAKRRHPN